MLKRKVSERLLEWKRTHNNQGLMVTGARQVGKTTAVEQFAKEHYSNILKIDFVEQPSAVELITGSKDVNDLLLRITSLAKRPLPDGKTLLFFDEVQRCQDAITWMRYLAKDGRFDVVYSGSLLGIEAYSFRSLPVGTLDTVEMFPLDFQEFTWADNVDESLWDIARECMQERRELPPFIHDRLMDEYWHYVLVGGMPEAVKTYASTRDTQAVRARQKGILENYRADITRYVESREHAQRIRTIFDSIPAQLNKENRRFVVSGIDKDQRFQRLQPDFDWLEEAGVVIPVKRAAQALYPLGMSREDSYFKFYLNDVGLLFSTFSPADVEAVLQHKDELNFGQAFENTVAQELRASGHEQLFYFNSAKIGEVDFLLDGKREPSVLPVEVKSGRYSTKHAALDRLLEVENYHIERAVVLHRGNVSRSGKVTYLPIYLAAFL